MADTMLRWLRRVESSIGLEDGRETGQNFVHGGPLDAAGEPFEAAKTANKLRRSSANDIGLRQCLWRRVRGQKPAASDVNEKIVGTEEV